MSKTKGKRGSLYLPNWTRLTQGSSTEYRRFLATTGWQATTQGWMATGGGGQSLEPPPKLSEGIELGPRAFDAQVVEVMPRCEATRMGITSQGLEADCSCHEKMPLGLLVCSCAGYQTNGGTSQQKNPGHSGPRRLSTDPRTPVLQGRKAWSSAGNVRQVRRGRQASPADNVKVLLDGIRDGLDHREYCVHHFDHR